MARSLFLQDLENPKTPTVGALGEAKAEVGVQIIERWILAKLRHHSFFSLAELNHCIRALLIEVNNKPFKQLKGSRQQWFESLDKPALAPLPKQAYQYPWIWTRCQGTRSLPRAAWRNPSLLPPGGLMKGVRVLTPYGGRI